MTSDEERGKQGWRVVLPFRLHWLFDDDEAVVYFDGSGDTHLLGRFAADVLRRIEDGPVSAFDLVAQAVDESGEPELRIRPAIDEALREFRRLGLIEPSHV
ncbi:MAG: HPr-rel-A system PqqD family peptide chaperone [Alphaproteobacteria bacterium]